MTRIILMLAATLLTAGCASNLKAVRSFADETKKISVAFDPVLIRVIEQCRQRALDKSVYTSSRPISQFAPKEVVADAVDTCQPIAESNATAKQISQALSDYANQLAELAADGVASSVDDNYDALASNVEKFPGVPKEKVGAITALLKFITRTVVAQAQRDAVVEALSHEEAIDTLADALVIYVDRVYGGYLKDRAAIQDSIILSIRSDNASPITTRLQLMEIYQQGQMLDEQQKTVASFRRAVGQMKAALRDLRQNVDKLTAQERFVETKKLAKEVKALYDQLAKAF